jgi:CubicO group peptidase (beta-lactamase class C family)
VVRRADGRTIDQVVREEITGPLGIGDDLVYGIAESMAPRVAVVVDDAPDDPAARPPTLKMVMPEAMTLTMVNRPDLLRACVPSGCTGSARALARMYAVLAQGGELDGIRLMTRERVTIASTLAIDAPDAMTGGRALRALGYGIGGPDEQGFGHGGAGGSLGWAVPEHRFAFALAKNNLTADAVDPSTKALVIREVRAALAIPV